LFLFCSLSGHGQQQTVREKSATLSQSNLAPNPSFEDGDDTPIGWMTEISRGDGTFDWKTAPGRTDGHSLSIGNIQAGSNLRWVNSSFIPIQPDQDYEISAWYKNTTQTSSVAFLAEFWGEKPYALGSTGIWQMKPSSEWVHRSFLIHEDHIKKSFPGANRIKLSFGGSSKNDETGAVWIDEVVFRKATASQ
jgi:hypothetical protein